MRRSPNAPADPQEILPDNSTFDIRFETVAADFDADACVRTQFAVSETGPVEFEESGTEFRSSAYPVMDRVVTLADACRDATSR